ncbi:ral-GDS-related protein-like [Manis javanica]|uniref:ral-GDS-related protein-like n=1 Tax=Manis javanica TaxID=9974 RepID=UPI003C6D1B6C
MGRRYQPEKASIEHVAPIINKVMKQFEATVRLVTTCCLGTPSMMARDRARVVEFWIRVAKECETFLNFASLHAILLALQCPPVGRLKRTWGHVSWKSAYIFKKLKKKDKKADRQWFHEEAKRLLTRWQWDQRTPDYQETQGMVPFLGYILDDVPMEQLTEHNDEVISILYEIGMQRYAARKYDLDPDERFQSFLKAVEPLDEQQRSSGTSSVGRQTRAAPQAAAAPQGPVRSCSQSGLLPAGSSPLLVARWTEASCPTTRRVSPLVHVASRVVNTTCCLGAISHRVVATRFQEKVGPSSPGLDIPGMDTDTAQCCTEPPPPGSPEEASEDAGVASGHRFPGAALSNFHPSSLRNSLPVD